MLTDALIRGVSAFDCANPHGSYNLEKVLNFTSRLEKILNSGLGTWNVLDFFIRSWKVLELTTLSTPDTFFSVKLDYFAEKNLAHPQCKNQ